MSDVIVAPATRDLGELARDLSNWLATKMPGASDIVVDNLTYPRGAGQSHETILFDAKWNQDGEERAQGCVVRIKPSSFTVFVDTLFEEQYKVMQVLHEGSYVKVAKPLWFEEDSSILGNPFFVMEKVQGRVPVSIPPYAREGWLSESTPQQRRKLWENAVVQLAAVQSVPLGKLGFLKGPPGAESGLAQEWDKYERGAAWVQEHVGSPALARSLERLKSLWPENRPEGLVWGDARIGNMMFDDDFEVVAVMDWEQPSLGGALHDLAWFLVLSEIMHGRNAQNGAYLEGMGTREETIARWEEITGKSAADIEWYEDFTHFKMTCTGLRMGHWRGKQMMDEAAIARRLKVD
ncbi:MAG: phosphotransferase family protein [Novosphingobium sp.]|nr:phosphotransferase family protein [Novosphingobium sp.]MCP5401274.1 phosphotransferase family protein [Novosphingobium sp.]